MASASSMKRTKIRSRMEMRGDTSDAIAYLRMLIREVCARLGMRGVWWRCWWMRAMRGVERAWKHIQTLLGVGA